MVVEFAFKSGLSTTDPSDSPVLIIGQLCNLKALDYEVIKAKFGDKVSLQTFCAGVDDLRPNPTDTISLWLDRVTVAALPTKISRHNTPSRSHSVARLAKCGGVADNGCIVMVCERVDLFASVCAISRAFPLYNKKSTASSTKRQVTVEFVVTDGGDVTSDEIKLFSDAEHAVRHSAQIVDMPCSEMHTDAFIEQAKLAHGDLPGVQMKVIQGEELNEKGFGGIFGVGKAAIHQPAMVVLSHTPAGATKTIAWVGKGIVYDTGGLSIKGKTAMPGMKRDCGGAAGVLGAFHLAVNQGFRENLHVILCLAENAVGPKSTRPDDILYMYSGKTVEVNNTDAEGRLVLADGVSYANKELKADVILDMATLTGAQGISTGRYHGALLTNNEEWECLGMAAGKKSGDLVFPIPYSPELHFPEFHSAIADMKNSVADRSNAQSSCAGLFIGSHLGFDYPGVWVHVDMAYPVHVGERATGYGVALLNVLFGAHSNNALLRSLAPSSCCDTGSPESKKQKTAE